MPLQPDSEGGTGVSSSAEDRQPVASAVCGSRDSSAASPKIRSMFPVAA